MELSLEICQKQEQELIFSHFNHQDAFVIGNYIAKKSIQKKYPIAVVIEINHQVIFQYLNDGASLNNLEWIHKKRNVVTRFEKSSAYMTYKLEKEDMTFEQKYGDSSQYAITPGAFPIRVHNVGVIGTIAVSGLSSQDDHGLIIEACEYLLSSQEEEQ